MRPYVTVTALPQPNDTTIRIHPWPGEITIIQIGDLGIQFDTREAALAWLEEAGELLQDAMQTHDDESGRFA